jgi:hypothetical protein
MDVETPFSCASCKKPLQPVFHTITDCCSIRVFVSYISWYEVAQYYTHESVLLYAVENLAVLEGVFLGGKFNNVTISGKDGWSLRVLLSFCIYVDGFLQT